MQRAHQSEVSRRKVRGRCGACTDQRRQRLGYASHLTRPAMVRKATEIRKRGHNTSQSTCALQFYRDLNQVTYFSGRPPQQTCAVQVVQLRVLLDIRAMDVDRVCFNGACRMTTDYCEYFMEVFVGTSDRTNAIVPSKLHGKKNNSSMETLRLGRVQRAVRYNVLNVQFCGRRCREGHT
jgi:hypothetical protein